MFPQQLHCLRYLLVKSVDEIVFLLVISRYVFQVGYCGVVNVISSLHYQWRKPSLLFFKFPNLPKILF